MAGRVSTIEPELREDLPIASGDPAMIVALMERYPGMSYTEAAKGVYLEQRASEFGELRERTVARARAGLATIAETRRLELACLELQGRGLAWRDMRELCRLLRRITRRNTVDVRAMAARHAWRGPRRPRTRARRWCSANKLSTRSAADDGRGRATSARRLP